MHRLPLLSLLVLAAVATARDQLEIVIPAGSSGLERFAAREVRRYVYLTTGELLPVVDATSAPRAGIVVGRRSSPVIEALLGQAPPATAGEYWIETHVAHGRALVVAGADETATLYGAYRLAEHLGVRFYLHGDVIPDRHRKLDLPFIEEHRAPLFALRGIQPFHDFPEGPDWWNRDDYLAIISQLPKLGMNFIGLHTYPEGAPNAEPTVWIGPREHIGPRASVKASYPASYQNTSRGNWGYHAKKTSAYRMGAAQLFERDEFGAEIMWDAIPSSTNDAACNQVFERTALLLHDAFTHARQLGVKTCVGTETPLVVPKEVRERLKAQGKDTKDPEVVRELYRGTFARAAQAYPLDYYWLWTPECWTWEGTKAAQVAATTNDLLAAIAAARDVKAPFSLATCGWVLGPQQDRALFNTFLPREMAVSCINREVGRTPVDAAFAKVEERGKWAIPWLEDDPALTSPQLWVGRMRRDAADARRYGCDGLMGIHWRTRVLGPAAAALAEAAWEQDQWTSNWPPQPVHIAGAVGGKFAAFADHKIAGTDRPKLYQTVRYDVSAYHLAVPDGTYSVTLRFCEPHYKAAGKRVFDVAVQSEKVLDHLDIFAKAGADRALDYTFGGVNVTNRCLDIQFTPVVEYPCIAAISVHGPAAYLQKIDCGGSGFQDYAADFPVMAAAAPKYVYPPTTDFFADWARSEFGEGAGEAAAIFARIDGALPRPSDWVGGPGGIRPDKRRWAEVEKQYGFVDELAALEKSVRGAGAQERFAWWLNTFRYMKAMARVNCTWASYTNAAGAVKGERTMETRRQLARERLLPLRRQLVGEVEGVYDHLLATISNTGELGTLMNWEQHLLPDVLEKPGRELADMLGSPLPADAELRGSYRGPMRVIVPTVRTSFERGERLALKVLVLSEQAPQRADVWWRPMGSGRFTDVPLEHVARGVYWAELPVKATMRADLEYYVEVRGKGSERARFPRTAPDLNVTLVAGE